MSSVLPNSESVSKSGHNSNTDYMNLCCVSRTTETMDLDPVHDLRIKLETWKDVLTVTVHRERSWTH